MRSTHAADIGAGYRTRFSCAFWYGRMPSPFTARVRRLQNPLFTYAIDIFLTQAMYQHKSAYLEVVADKTQPVRNLAETGSFWRTMLVDDSGGGRANW